MSEESKSKSYALPKSGGVNKTYAESVAIPEKYPMFENAPNTPENSPFFHFKVSRDSVVELKVERDSLPNIDQVALAWAEQYHQFITDPVIQFVSAVAGHLEEKTESLLIDQFSNLKKVFEKMTNDQILSKYKGSSDFQKFQEFLELYNREFQTTDIRLEYTKLFFLIQAATDQYFSPVLSSHIMQAIGEIKSLTVVSQSPQIMFFYLIRHEYWMNKFARLVAASIRLARQYRYVSSKKFQVENAIQVHAAALQEFQNFSIKNLYGNDKRSTTKFDTTPFNEVFTVKSKFAAVNI